MKNFFKKCVSTVLNDHFVGRTFYVNGQQIEAISQIAQGSYAFVYETSSKDYVIKHMNVQTQTQLEEVFNEVHFQGMLSYHQNINKLVAAFVNQRPVDKNATYDQYRNSPLPCEFDLILERCETPVLTLLNQTKGFLPEEHVLQLFAGAVAGFTVQHNHGITNWDAKIENLLLRSMNHQQPLDRRNIRICDFGSCHTQEYPDGSIFIRNPALRSNLESTIQSKTTPQYRAPELIDLYSRMPITRKADVFALGVVLYRLMYKKLPFPEGEILANFNVRYQFPDETDEFLKRSKYEDRSDVPIYSDYCKSLVRMCLVRNPAERATIWQVAAKLQEKLGDFGAEPQRADSEIQLEVQQQSETQQQTHCLQNGTNASSLSASGPLGGDQFANMFDWAPVQGTQQQNQPQIQHQQIKEQQPPVSASSSVPASAANAQLQLFDWAPVQPIGGAANQLPQMPQAPQQTTAPAQASAQMGDLFSWAPVQTQANVQLPMAPQPQVSSQQATQPVSAPVPVAKNTFDSLLDWGAPVSTKPVQAAIPTQTQQHQQLLPQQQPAQQQLNAFDDLLDFAPVSQPDRSEPSGSAPSATATTTRSVSAPHQGGPRTAVPPADRAKAAQDALMTNPHNFEPLNSDEIMQHTRRTACAIFTSASASVAKIQERYRAMALQLQQCLRGQLDAGKAKQLDSNFQMLINQNKGQPAGAQKEVIRRILLDLCTLQRMSVGISNLTQYCHFDDNYNVVYNDISSGESASQVSDALCSILDCIHGLCQLQQGNPFLKQEGNLLATIAIRPILQATQAACRYGGLPSANAQRVRQAYSSLAGSAPLGVMAPAALETARFAE